MTAAKRWLDGPAANRLWKIMAAVALLLSVAVGLRQYRMTACQARYNEASNVSQQARAEAAEADRVALDRLLRVVARTPQEALDAIRGYNSARDDADRQRAANPVPPPPSETCG